MEERRRLERGLRDSVVRVKRDEAVEQVMILMIVMAMMMAMSVSNIVFYNPLV